MIINVRDYDRESNPLPDKYRHMRVLVDGREIDGVWYVDTVAKVVKTLHIFQDADESLVKRLAEWWGSDRDLRRMKFATEDKLLRLIPIGWEIEAEPEGPISRIIRGRIELIFQDEP